MDCNVLRSLFLAVLRSSRKDDLVAEFVKTGGPTMNWDLHFRMPIREVDMEETVGLLQKLSTITLQMDKEDVRSWKTGKTNSFSVASSFKCLITCSASQPFLPYKMFRRSCSFQSKTSCMGRSLELFEIHNSAAEKESSYLHKYALCG